MPEVGTSGAGVPSTAASEIGVYAKDVSNIAQLFAKGEATGSEYQLTSMASGADSTITRFGTNLLYDAAPQNQYGGWTFLPGGLLLMYGTSNIPPASQTVRFPKSFSAVPYSIQLTMQSGATSTTSTFYVENIAQANNEMYIYNTSSNTRLLNWMAIGLA